jgi:hypothetical protein
MIFKPWRGLWKSWAPFKCKTFLWLVIRNKCWRVDHLASKVLPHLEHCDQEDETAQHILTTCVFVWQFWHNQLAPAGLDRMVLRVNEIYLYVYWWRKASRPTDKAKWKGFNSVVTLRAWTMWIQRNRCIYDGATPPLHVAQCFS